MTEGQEKANQLTSDGPPATNSLLAEAISNGNPDAMSSSKCSVPAALDASCTERFRQCFMEEFDPVGVTETILACELARHAAGIERWDQGCGAVERQAARHLPNLVTDKSFMDTTAADAVLAGAMTTEAADRCERHSLLRSRAFLRTLDKLQAVQAFRREREGRQNLMPPLGFADEAACERYLTDRLRRGLVPCPKCGATEGCVIAARKSRECRGCKTHIGMRTNTIMARSPVPLRLWFDAVRLLLWRPTIDVAELAEKVGLTRIATVRSMMAKIRTAMATDNASELLAGLDRYFSST